MHYSIVNKTFIQLKKCSHSLSTVLQVQFCLTTVSKPHKEKILSANAWEAGAQLRSFAIGARIWYDAHLAVQNSKELSAEYSSTSFRYLLCSCCATMSGPLLPPPPCIPAVLEPPLFILLARNLNFFRVADTTASDKSGDKVTGQMMKMTTMSQSLTTWQ